jgi:toxin ParE1/3/4
MKLRFNELAAADVQAITRFYLRERLDLAVSFIEQLSRSVSLLVENPELGRPLQQGYRRVTLKRFPYTVVYRVDRDAGTIRIVSVAHQRRRPGTWATRVEECAPDYAYSPMAA